METLTNDVITLGIFRTVATRHVLLSLVRSFTNFSSTYTSTRFSGCVSFHLEAIPTDFPECHLCSLTHVDHHTN